MSKTCKRGKGARQSGHRYERIIKADFIDAGYKNCITAREGNRLKDSQGIDLLNTGMFDVQVKNYKSFRNPLNDLDKMPDSESRIKVLAMNIKNGAAFVTMPKDRFFKILKSIDYKTLRMLMGKME